MTTAQVTKRVSNAMHPSLFTSLRGPSGEPWWFSVSTSSFRAKDEIILSRDCLDVMIERAESGDGPRGSEELRLLHLPIRLGVCEHSGRVGRWLLETGPWDDTPIARSMRAALDAEPGVWCVSISFKGDTAPDVDGILNKATLWERSVVTARHALEPWTSISTLTKRRSNLMDIVTLLKSMLPQAADELLEGLEKQAEELDANGVDSRADLDALAAAITDAADQAAQAAGAEADEAASERAGADDKDKDGDTEAGAGLSLAGLSARMDDLEMAIEGLASRQPEAEEVTEKAVSASRAAVSTELTEVTEALKQLRGLLDPQGRREGDPVEGSAQSEDEIAAAIKEGLDAASNIDPKSLLYL